MASPAYVSFMTDGKPIEGSVVQPGKQGTSLVIAFQHAVLFTGTELFTGNPVREHKPVLLIKELDKSSITLYQLLTRGTFIEKATIDWYRFNEKSKKDEIYFQHILEKVKITSIRLIMPHIKNPQFERNVHMEEVALRYDRIAWVYPEGNIRYTDRWLYAFLLGGMNKSEQKEWDAIMGKEAATDDFADWLDERTKKEKQVVKIHLVDSNNNILAEVKITLDNGDEYDTDKNGDVKIELKEDKEDVKVTRIGWPKKEEEGESAVAEDQNENKKVNVLEIEDVLFRYNSAVYLPDSNYQDESGTKDQAALSGINVLKAVLNRAEKFKKQKVLIAGHTDRSGPDEYNFKLSGERAHALLHLLLNEKEPWVEIAHNRHSDKDLQHILKWAAQTKGWMCDPGKVDGILGDATNNAIVKFQKAAGIQADGVFGRQTWGVVFDLYQEQLTNVMESDETSKQSLDNRNAINWAYDKKAVGCGELWPISDAMKSQTDRRVEVLFFDEKELPECACKDGVCNKEECPIYKDGVFEKSYINIEGFSPSDMLEFKIYDSHGNPLDSIEFQLKFSNGSVLKNTTDKSGYAKVEEKPEGECRFEICGDHYYLE